MKYKIKAGTNVRAHTVGTLFDFQDFKWTTTDMDVTLTSKDVWFHKDVKDLDTTLTDTWLTLAAEQYVGFKLPENKKEIDCILVPREVIKYRADLDDDDSEESHVSKDKQLQRKLRQQSDNHWGAGKGLPH